MSTPAVTAYAETAALYAVLNQDETEALRLVGNMFPAERAFFAKQLDQLRSMLTDEFGNDIGRPPAERRETVEYFVHVPDNEEELQ